MKRQRTVAACSWLAIALLGVLAADAARADDKDLLKRGSVPPNVLIVFGNSQTTNQPILGSASAWDGDADSPSSKMGAAKRVLRRFVAEKRSSFNIGMTSFAHNPNAGSITIYGKHWLYAPLTDDFPSESWKEPAGTIERWGANGEGPCTTLVTPSCVGPSAPYVTLPSSATVVGPFFGGVGGNVAFVYLNGNANNASRRIQITLTSGQYGDAYSDGTLTSLTLAGPPPHSAEVRKEYQEKRGGAWQTMSQTPSGNPGAVTVFYAPPATLGPDSFFQTDPDAGRQIGFLNDPKNDFAVGANCSGWEFQTNSAPLPLVKIPRDYSFGDACLPPQDSTPCLSRLMRPQAVLTSYDPATGAFQTIDHDNPGYGGSGSLYADGCNPALLGAVDAGLNVTENQAILTTRNGSQAPIKDLLKNIYDYFNNPAIDGFQNGKRLDDPDATCRSSAVILIYDNFNGCQNDNCSYLTNFILGDMRTIGVPVYVIGFGASAAATSSTGVCIAQNTGATVCNSGNVGYFSVSSADGLYQALSDIFSIVNEGSKDFAAATVSSVQAGAGQMVFLATFNAAKNRSIWNGRINGYRLDPTGALQTGTKTVTDPNDPFRNQVLTVPSNDPSSLIWNAGQNLLATPGTGATSAAAVLSPGVPLSPSGSYLDTSNDTSTTIPTHFYPGRKVVFSLPQGLSLPVTSLPIAPGSAVPENRYDLTVSTGASWWPALKSLLGPQTSPPAVASPAIADVDASNTLRFLWGDRDAVLSATQACDRYQGLKLGDIFHSTPMLIGGPSDFAFYTTNLNDYRTFYQTYKYRRRVLFAGANDGLLHAFDVGAFARDLSVCIPLSDGTRPPCYDLGTGAELFAYAPRSVLPVAKRLKDGGTQTKQNEWTVDGGPAAADVFTDANHSGSPDPARRAWRTVLVGGMREGSAFEGMGGASPRDSQGSFYALDVTQPDELAADANNALSTVVPATYLAPKCLNADGDGSCGHDAADPAVRSTQPPRAWPTVLWELTDVADADAAGSPGAGYPDMGESWSKPAIGRVRVCSANCGNTGSPAPVIEDRYVAIFGGGFDRERRNRRGNWLYMIDIETGRMLYRANSSCGVNAGSGSCTPTYFGSIPSEPAALDLNGDGYMDYVYVGDLKGQVWRIDLTDLRLLSSLPASRFAGQLDLVNGSGRPFLFFRAPQPVAPATTPFYPIYFRPTAVSLGYTSANTPVMGIAFGTGDRDDILATVDPSSLLYANRQRFYYVLDNSNTVTRTEADLVPIDSPSSGRTTVATPNGWFLKFNAGERVITDSLAIKGVVFFSTFNPNPTGTSAASCGNAQRCGGLSGTARFYQMLYANGDPYLGEDRGETQPNASFLTNPIFFTSTDRQGHIFFTSDNTITIQPVPGGTRTTVKDWKEK